MTNIFFFSLYKRQFDNSPAKMSSFCRWEVHFSRHHTYATLRNNVQILVNIFLKQFISCSRIFCCCPGDISAVVHEVILGLSLLEFVGLAISTGVLHTRSDRESSHWNSHLLPLCCRQKWHTSSVRDTLTTSGHMHLLNSKWGLKCKWK